VQFVTKPEGSACPSTLASLSDFPVWLSTGSRVLQALMKEASKTESTSLEPFCCKSLTTFLLYYVDETGFSDFTDKPAEHASCVAFLSWFN
jgi:hypothetical protein